MSKSQSRPQPRRSPHPILFVSDRRAGSSRSAEGAPTEPWICPLPLLLSWRDSIYDAHILLHELGYSSLLVEITQNSPKQNITSQLWHEEVSQGLEFCGRQILRPPFLAPIFLKAGDGDPFRAKEWEEREILKRRVRQRGASASAVRKKGELFQKTDCDNNG